jgi:integrase
MAGDGGGRVFGEYTAGAESGRRDFPNVLRITRRAVSAGEGLRADRERATLCVAYETLARRGELVALEVRDIDFHPDGTGQALIRRGKTDAEGQGRVAYLSRETVRWLKVWLEHAEINEGAVFRRLIGTDKVGGPLNPGSARIRLSSQFQITAGRVERNGKLNARFVFVSSNPG